MSLREHHLILWYGISFFFLVALLAVVWLVQNRDQSTVTTPDNSHQILIEKIF